MVQRESVSYWHSNDGSDFKGQVCQLVRHLESLANDLDIDMSMYYNDPSLEGPLIEKDLSSLREDMKKIIKYRSILDSQQKKLLSSIEDKLFLMQDPRTSHFEKELDELIKLVQELKEDLTKHMEKE
ncbi:MAG: hypothetical protein Tsb0015_05820 [Simkaniaceae bacterium]